MLTLVHKCNVLTHCGDLWVRVHKEMGDAHYPDIKQDYNHVDACTMWFVKQPEYYDVIVTENKEPPHESSLHSSPAVGLRARVRRQ